MLVIVRCVETSLLTMSLSTLLYSDNLLPLQTCTILINNYLMICTSMEKRNSSEGSRLNVVSRFKFVSSILVIFSINFSNSQRLYQECTLPVTNSSYKINIWVILPFDPEYKFSKARVQPTLDIALEDAKAQIQQVQPSFYHSFIEVRATKTQKNIFRI